MIPFWCPRAETFLTDWFTSGKPRRLLYRHTHNKKTTTERPNRSARRRRSLRLHQLFHQVSRKNIGKKQKYKRKTKQFYPHRFSSIFCFFFLFFHFFWPPLFRLCRRLLLQLSQSNFNNNNKKSIIWSGQACIFFLLGKKKEKWRYTNMKNDLECVDIPLLYQCDEMAVSMAIIR